MKRRVPAALGPIASTLLLAAALPAEAQTFPADADFFPLRRDRVPLADPQGDFVQPPQDVVADESDPAAAPAALVDRDETHLFLRMRVDASVVSGQGFVDGAWACLVDTTANLRAYELGAGVSGTQARVELRKNTSTANPNSPLDPSELVVAAFPIATHAREAPAGSTFGGNADVFVDWAIDASVLAAVGVDESTPLRFVCGTSQGVAALTGDLISLSGATDLFTLASDTYRCTEASGCTPCTSTNACGPTCAVCAVDAVCDPERGCVACTVDAECTDPALPACDPETNTCVACAEDADCLDPAAPSCHPQTNACVACVEDADCQAPAAPACRPTTDTCVACDPQNPCTNGTFTCDLSAGTCSLLPALDTDGDGLSAVTEATFATQDNNPDTDGDGIEDGVEVFNGTEPDTADTDGDGLNDGEEDLDQDGLLGPLETDPNNPDTDGDGLADGAEDANQDGIFDPGETNPRDADTDDDGLADGAEDANQNGVLDAGETDPRLADTDGDGLQDGTERGLQVAARDTDLLVFQPDLDPSTTTNPNNPDTDGGGATDGDEDENNDGKLQPGERNPVDDPADDAVDPCVFDAECGGLTSGQICEDIGALSACIPGCRGEGGNGCPIGFVCTSTDATAGTCVGGTGGAGGGVGGVGGAGGAGGVGGAGVGGAGGGVGGAGVGGAGVGGGGVGGAGGGVGGAGPAGAGGTGGGVGGAGPTGAGGAGPTGAGGAGAFTDEGYIAKGTGLFKCAAVPGGRSPLSPLALATAGLFALAAYRRRPKGARRTRKSS